MSELSITAAIVAFEAQATIEQAVRSLNEQTSKPDEVLVIDDGSGDQTGAIAARAGARVIAHETCRGVAAARNTALDEAQGDIIVFIDADAKAHPEMIAQMLREYSLDSVAGVGGQGNEVVATGLANRWRSIFWRQTHGSDPQRHVWMLPGLCCSYRIEDLKAIGGFDERFRTNGEDVDIGLRLLNTHRRLVYRPDVQVDHHRRDGFRSLFSMVYRHSRWQAAAVRKNDWRTGYLLGQSLKWILITSGSSLKRHHSLSLALLSPLVTTWAVVGRLRGILGARLAPPTVRQ